MANENLIETVSKFCALVPQELNLKDAYIFAPEAKGYKYDEVNPDVVLVFSNIASFHEIDEQLNRLMKTAGVQFQLQILEENEMNIDNPLAWEVLNNCIEIGVGQRKAEFNSKSTTAQKEL